MGSNNIWLPTFSVARRYGTRIWQVNLHTITGSAVPIGSAHTAEDWQHLMVSGK
jgi:hypothetical protein